ncbi:hypothetical protein Syun_014277 [Stephania yunnanensis]|uniref:NB-ARC domain-containing protein n=1 Tax=Stephania yunnanensis TaxID=152371 RepID=A0AAP0P8L4_9MAGN
MGHFKWTPCDGVRHSRIGICDARENFDMVLEPIVLQWDLGEKSPRGEVVGNVISVVDLLGKLSKGFVCLELPNDMRDQLEIIMRNLETMDENQDPRGCVAEQTLRYVAYELEDFVEKCKQFHERNSKPMSYITNLSSIVTGKRKKLKDILRNLLRIRKEIMFSWKVDYNSLSNRTYKSEYSIRTVDEEVVGLDVPHNTIELWIYEAAATLNVLGIYGMPGVGKKTLARKIWQDMKRDESNHRFDHALFVSLEPNFDLKDVVKCMLESLSGKVEVSERADEYELLEKLHEQLRKKKYFIVLDGVWQISNRSWWNSMKSALPKEKNGSCVIVTTQVKEVARSMGAIERHIYNLEPLSEGNSLKLFSTIAFSSNESHQPPNTEIRTIANEIANKLGGLPLAIKVAARIMSGKELSIFSWKQRAKHFNEELLDAESEFLYSILRVSYEQLSRRLKNCMLCFSIFPEDYEISFEEVVDLWASQGIIPKTEGSKTALEIGEECFNQLIDRSLLIGVRKDIFETRFQSCKLPIMIRLVMMKIAKDKNFMLVEGDQELKFPHSPRVGIVEGSQNMDQLGRFNPKLRILVGRDMAENGVFVSNVKPKKFKQKHLRVLDLSFDRESDSSNEITSENWLGDTVGSLPQLACLKIKNSTLTHLPKSLMHLRNLQSLCLSQCYHLKKLPPEIVYLKELTVLDVSSCDSIQCLPKQIKSLTNLEILYGFKPSKSKGKCSMSSLKQLTQLRKLWIQIDSEYQVEEDEFMVLSELQKLEALALTSKKKDNDAAARTLDFQLPTLHQLHALYLHSLSGESSPQWLNPACLPNLSYLHIYESHIRSFGNSFYGNGETKFEKLEALALTELTELEEKWPTMKAAMPSLRLLKIEECPKLRSLDFPVENGLGCWVR